jgi:hypothetical protein
VTGGVRSPEGYELFVDGTHTCEILQGPSASLYLFWGDWFAFLCLGLAAVVVWQGRPRFLRR